MVRCPDCGTLVSEWAAICPRCGADVAGEPLIADARRPPSGKVAPSTTHPGDSPRRRWRRPGGVRRAGAILAALAAIAAATAWTTGWAAVRGTGVRVPAAAGPYVPVVRQDRGRSVAAVTLLDGRRLELAYPPSLAIAGLGLTLAAEVRWPGASATSCCAARVSASHATLAQAYGNSPPLGTYPGRGRHPVPLFSASDRRLPPGFTGQQNLAFAFGSWLVEVDTTAMGSGRSPPPMAEADRRLWASGLAASVTASGYVVLAPHQPLALAPADASDRLSATFGLGGPNEPQRNIVDIEDGDCVQPTSDTAVRRPFRAGSERAGVSWCDPATRLHVTAIGPASFVEAVGSSLTLAVTSGP